jgi:hypothetical protein
MVSVFPDARYAWVPWTSMVSMARGIDAAGVKLIV